MCLPCTKPITSRLEFGTSSWPYLCLHVKRSESASVPVSMVGFGNDMRFIAEPATGRKSQDFPLRRIHIAESCEPGSKEAVGSLSAHVVGLSAVVTHLHARSLIFRI